MNFQFFLLISLVFFQSGIAIAQSSCFELFADNRPTVIALTKINEHTELLRVSKPDGLQFKPGDAVRVTLQTEMGPQSHFLSIANSSADPFIEFAVRTSGSDFKTAFSNLKPGMNIEISQLRSALKFSTEQPAIMIAGGIGITPFRSFIQFIMEQNLPTPLHLYYANKTAADIAFKDEFDQLSTTKSNFKVTYRVSEDSPGWTKPVGRIDEDFLAIIVALAPENSIFYVVGPPQMVLMTKTLLARLGLSGDRIRVELFPGY